MWRLNPRPGGQNGGRANGRGGVHLYERCAATMICVELESQPFGGPFRGLSGSLSASTFDVHHDAELIVGTIRSSASVTPESGLKR